MIRLFLSEREAKTSNGRGIQEQLINVQALEANISSHTSVDRKLNIVFSLQVVAPRSISFFVYGCFPMRLRERDQPSSSLQGSEATPLLLHTMFLFTVYSKYIYMNEIWHCTSLGTQPQTRHLRCTSDERFSRYVSNKQTDRQIPFLFSEIISGRV